MADIDADLLALAGDSSDDEQGANDNAAVETGSSDSGSEAGSDAGDSKPRVNGAGQARSVKHADAEEDEGEA